MYLRNVEREQLRFNIKAIMQGRTDERSKSRVKLAWTMPSKEEVEYYSTDYERSALPLRSSKKAALNGCFYTWTSKLTIYV